MSHTLTEMEVANISEESLQKLRDAEKAINSMGGSTQKEEIYLLALTRQGTEPPLFHPSIASESSFILSTSFSRSSGFAR